MTTVHYFSDGLYAKEMFIPKGMSAVQHKHSYDHLSILAKGKVIVMYDDGYETVNAPACLEIKKGINHAITALEDSVWYCVHHTFEKDSKKIDEVLITKE